MYIIADDIIDDLQGFVKWSTNYGWHFTTLPGEAARFADLADAQEVIDDHYADAIEHGVNLHPIYTEE